MVMNYAHFTVSGKHQSPEYAAKTYTVDVHYSDNEHGFFCTNDELGCSRRDFALS